MIWPFKSKSGRDPEYNWAGKSYPALRLARDGLATDRSGASRLDLDFPEGDWPADVAAMQSLVARAVDVVLRDADDPLHDLPLRDPDHDPKHANWINRDAIEGDARFRVDIEENDGARHRIRNCSVTWPSIGDATRAAYARFFDDWRRKHLDSGAAHEILDEGFNHERVLATGLGWCLGTNDPIHIRMEESRGDILGVAVTRAFIYDFERQRCQ